MALTRAPLRLILPVVLALGLALGFALFRRGPAGPEAANGVLATSRSTPSERMEFALSEGGKPVLLAARRFAGGDELPPAFLEALEERREAMARMVREDPAAALAAALTPHEFASLPPELQELVERPLAAVGFYGVLAICSHDPVTGHSAACRIERHVFIDGRDIPVSIYGARIGRLTEEDASLYGVEIGGVLALHADDAVVFPAERMSDDPAHAGHFAVIYRGHTSFFADRTAVDTHLSGLNTP